MRQRLSGVDDVQARAPRIGKLRIGETVEKTRPDGSTYSYPIRLDHIKAADGAGNIVQAFHDVYGEEPTEFLAVFPSNDVAEWYWERYARYGSGTGLACHGNGHLGIDELTGESIDCPCQHAEPTVKGDREYPPACKIVASVSLFLYEVPELGLFQIDTSGMRSCSNAKWFIRHGLPGLSGGQLAGIPIKVSIEPYQVVHDGQASTAYQWRFGLAPGMRPQDVQIAAKQAVSGFCLPVGSGAPMLDEGKPEELYPQIPATIDDADPGECIGGAESVGETVLRVGIPGEAVEAEVKLRRAMKAAKFTEPRLESTEKLMSSNRAKAEEKNDFATYVDWLERQADHITPKSEQ